MQYVKKIYKKKKREKTFVTVYCCAIFLCLWEIFGNKEVHKKRNKNTYNVNACLTDVRVSFKCVKVDMKGSR